jgi:hypothetical protein
MAAPVVLPPSRTFSNPVGGWIAAAAGCLSLLFVADGRRMGAWREPMPWRRRLAVLFVVLALTGCTQETTGQAQAPYAPYSPENNGNMRDSGGAGGGGGDSM